MENIEEFNEILLKTTTDEDIIKFIRKHIFHGTPFVFKGKETEYFEFRYRIAKQFNLNFDQVFIVGSSKLGFSYYKRKEFDYDSDIDVVIINDKLFDFYHKELSTFQYCIDSSSVLISLEEKKMYEDFLRYFIKGWMRPDKLPVSFQIKLLKDSWFDYFKSISNGKTEVGNYKVSAGLYKNYDFLEEYYLKSIKKHYEEVKYKGV